MLAQGGLIMKLVISSKEILFLRLCSGEPREIGWNIRVSIIPAFAALLHRQSWQLSLGAWKYGNKSSRIKLTRCYKKSGSRARGRLQWIG